METNWETPSFAKSISSNISAIVFIFLPGNAKHRLSPDTPLLSRTIRVKEYDHPKIPAICVGTNGDKVDDAQCL